MNRTLVLVALVRGGSGAVAQCVQRPPTARLPAAAPAASVATPVLAAVSSAPVFVPVLVPAFEFRFSPLPGATIAGYTAATDSVSVGQVAGRDTPPPTKDSWPTSAPATAPFPGPVVSLLRDRCARCHSAPNPKAGVLFFDGTGRESALIDRARVLRAVAEGRMPPSGPLPLADIQTFRQWAGTN